MIYVAEAVHRYDGGCYDREAEMHEAAGVWWTYRMGDQKGGRVVRWLTESVGEARRIYEAIRKVPGVNALYRDAFMGH